jgi:MGT family glycosyltransferase
MTRILFTTQPMAGHLRPALPIADELVRRGHEVAWYTGAKYAGQVADTGARVVPIASELDWDDADLAQRAAAAGRTPGLDALRWGLRTVFIDPMPALVRDLRRQLGDWQPEIVFAEQGFMAGPLFARAAGIPSVVLCVTPLGLTSVDTAPFGTGMRPSSTAFGRMRNRALNLVVRRTAMRDPQRAAERVVVELGQDRLPGFFLDWGCVVAERYLCPSVPEFEHPRSDLPPTVEFIGALQPRALSTWTAPAWWPDLSAARAAGRPVVLVTQGTLATDPRNLLLPTVAALADQDVLVVGTTGGPDPEQVLRADQRPANLRLERFVPFDTLLPSVDVTVTNGGFGGVQQSLAHAVPVISAGLSEDKMEVGMRVSCSGAGIFLRTDTPDGGDVAAAVRTVLEDGRYRRRAAELATAYARYAAAERAADIVEATADRVGRPATAVR